MLLELKLYFRSVPETAVEVRSLKIQSWYCKPVILESLGDYFQRRSNGLLFYITCEKYGCRQFVPKFHYTFPIGCVYEYPICVDSVEITPVFNDSALPFKKN